MSARGGIVFSACAVVSLSVHAALFGVGDLSAGRGTTGPQGEEHLAVAGSDGTLEALIDAFDTAQTAAEAAPEPVSQTEIAPEFVPQTPPVDFVAPPSALPVLAAIPLNQPLDAVAPRPKPANLTTPKPVKTPSDSASAKPSQPKAAPKLQRQRANGSGSAAAAGTKGPAQATATSNARANDLRASWGAKIRSRIERRKSYPAAAGRSSGKVVVRLTVMASGALAAVTIAQSSGNAALDQAAIAAVQRAGTFPAAPEGLTGARHSFSLAIAFKR